jgi:hypothetical protein
MCMQPRRTEWVCRGVGCADAEAAGDQLGEDRIHLTLSLLLMLHVPLLLHNLYFRML